MLASRNFLFVTIVWIITTVATATEINIPPMYTLGTVSNGSVSTIPNICSAFTPAGHPLVVIKEQTSVGLNEMASAVVKRFDGIQWINVAGPIASGVDVKIHDFEVDSTGRPVVLWSKSVAGSSAARASLLVSRLQGQAWVLIGDPVTQGFDSIGLKAKLEIDAKLRPVIAWSTALAGMQSVEMTYTVRWQGHEGWQPLAPVVTGSLLDFEILSPLAGDDESWLAITRGDQALASLHVSRLINRSWNTGQNDILPTTNDDIFLNADMEIDRLSRPVLISTWFDMQSNGPYSRLTRAEENGWQDIPLVDASICNHLALLDSICPVVTADVQLNGINRTEIRVYSESTSSLGNWESVGGSVADVISDVDCWDGRICAPSITSVAGVEIAELRLSHQRPNVLIIVADDLGTQVGCYGDSQAVTPRLDELALSSVRFDTAWVAQASCSSSRSAILTGLYPHKNGQYGLASSPAKVPLSQRFGLTAETQQRTLTKLLSRAGYRTGIFGKLHVNPAEAFPFDTKVSAGFQTRDVVYEATAADAFFGEQDTRPWFLMVNFFDPHVDKIDPPTGFGTQTYFPNQLFGLPSTPRGASLFGPLPYQGVVHPQMKERIANFYNAVERVDTGIGLVLDALEFSKQSENTVVIVLGDHGPPFARAKTTCYEAGLRIPLFVRWPQVSQPHLSSRLASTLDIVPTILDAAGFPHSLEMHGQSLRPTLTNPTDISWRTQLYGESQFHSETPFYPRRAVRDERYKLIVNDNASSSLPPDTVDECPAPAFAQQLPTRDPVRLLFKQFQKPPKFELFDLENDPWELTNLANNVAFRNRRDQMAKLVYQWRKQTSDPFLDRSFVHSLPGID